MTTEPVWDGEGQDPWLPDRLDDAADVATHETRVRDMVWVELAAWIISVAAVVLKTQRPDPTAVFSREPRWADAVNRIVNGPIRETIGAAYPALLGAGYRWNSRPAVTQHLADVRNRLSGVPDSVFALITRELSAGANAGEGLDALSRRVERVLSTTGTPRWANRATVIARTEVMGALNAGRFDAFGAVVSETGVPMESRWMAHIDNRTRRTHRAADGQRVPVGQPFVVGGASLRFPGDPMGPGRETIHCRCTMMLTTVGGNENLTYHRFGNH